MIHAIEISDPHILHYIRKYHFGALIEIKNGMPNLQRRQDTKRQVRRGRAILQRAVGDDSQIAGGLAIIKPTRKGRKKKIPDIKELDFLIEIEDYNPTILIGVAENLVRNGHDLLGEEDKEFLDRLMQLSERRYDLSLRSLLNPTPYTYSRLREETVREYNERLQKIKGAVLEMYVQRLFRRVMPFANTSRQTNYYIAVEVSMRDKKFAADRDTSTDLVIAAPRRDFTRALDTLVERYHARRQRISVGFPRTAWMK